MADIARCNNKDCIHIDECERYKIDGYFPYDFKSICNEKTNYKYIIKKESNIIKKDDDNNEN